MMTAFELPIVRAAQTIGDAWQGSMVLLFFSKWLVIIMGLALIVAYVWDRRSGRWVFLRALLAMVLAAAISLLLGRVFDRLRPFVSFPSDITLLIPKPASFFSFPSTHASVAFAVPCVLWRTHRRWAWVAVCAALMIGIARVAGGVHYPTDILGGIGVGALSALVAIRIGRKNIA